MSCSLFVCSIHFASLPSLIFLQADVVGVCKFNPPLDSPNRNHSAFLLSTLAVDIFSACLPTSSAYLPACLSTWPAFHHHSKRWQQRAQYWLQLTYSLSQRTFRSADCLLRLPSEKFHLLWMFVAIITISCRLQVCPHCSWIKIILTE